MRNVRIWFGGLEMTDKEVQERNCEGGFIARVYLKMQKSPKRQEKDTKGFYHRKQRE